MRTFDVMVTRISKDCDIVRVEASCPFEAREKAVGLARRQDRGEDVGIRWSEESKPTLRTEITSKRICA